MTTTADVSAAQSPAAPALTPGEALAKLFLDNADKGCNAENDVLIAELRQRMRTIQELHRSPEPAH